jgi:Bacterial HORMA domain 2
VHVTARGFVYATNEINRIFLESIIGFGLDPTDFLDSQATIEKGLQTWLTLRQIKAAYLEVYESGSGRVRTRIDLVIEFRTSQEERYETAIDSVKSAITQAGQFSGCKYRVVVVNEEGAASVKGWHDTELGSVEHLRKYDIGAVINTAPVGIGMGVYR